MEAASIEVLRLRRHHVNRARWVRCVRGNSLIEVPQLHQTRFDFSGTATNRACFGFAGDTDSKEQYRNVALSRFRCLFSWYILDKVFQACANTEGVIGRWAQTSVVVVTSQRFVPITRSRDFGLTFFWRSYSSCLDIQSSSLPTLFLLQQSHSFKIAFSVPHRSIHERLHTPQL